MASLTSTTSYKILILSTLLILLVSLSSATRPISSGVNVIDKCWRRNPSWWKNRQQLATCSVGFVGKMTDNIGKGLNRYTVTDPTDDPINPKFGTLRYGASKLKGKVWITFQRDMHIKLARPLLVSSFTTIDGRGSRVHIAGGACFLLHQVKNVIIHGIIFHHCRPQAPGPVIGPGSEIVHLGKGDADAIRMFNSSKIWIDHNTLYKSEDGLVDVTCGSTDVTISNNWFRNQDKVMLLGHDDDYVHDKNMRVTVVFNHFGPNCNQRMPRVRHGLVHVVNNFYQAWGDYAIGGSMNPSIISESNYFIAPNDNKKVTWKQDVNGKAKTPNWSSINDMFANGAYFKKTSNGSGKRETELCYNREQRFKVANAKQVRLLTRSSGALRCSTRSQC